MDFLRCVVERITYQNQENGYTVIKCKAKGYSDLVTVIGSMPDVHVGSVLSIQGQRKMDKAKPAAAYDENWEHLMNVAETQARYNDKGRRI